MAQFASESEYSTEEIELAKKLFSFYKEERERQGIPYAFWDTVSGDIKACWLHTSRQFIIVDGLKH